MTHVELKGYNQEKNTSANESNRSCDSELLNNQRRMEIVFHMHSSMNEGISTALKKAEILCS